MCDGGFFHRTAEVNREEQIVRASFSGRSARVLVTDCGQRRSVGVGSVGVLLIMSHIFIYTHAQRVALVRTVHTNNL